MPEKNSNPLGALGQLEMELSLSPRDIALLSAGVFVAMLLALIVAFALFPKR